MTYLLRNFFSLGLFATALGSTCLAAPYEFTSDNFNVTNDFVDANNIASEGFIVHPDVSVTWKSTKTVNADITVYGTLTVDTAGVLTVRTDGNILAINGSGALIIKGKATFSSSAALYLGASSSGAILVNSTGTLELKSDAILTIGSARQMILNGTLLVDNAIAYVAGKLTVSDGAECTVKNTGQVFVETSGSLVVKDGGTVIVNDQGLITVGSSNSDSIYLRSTRSGGLLQVDSGGALSIENAGELLINEDDSTVTVNGYVAAAAGALLDGQEISASTEFPFYAPYADVIPLLVDGNIIGGDDATFTADQCTGGFALKTDAAASIAEGVALTPAAIGKKVYLNTGSTLTLDEEALESFSVTGSGVLDYRVPVVVEEEEDVVVDPVGDRYIFAEGKHKVDQDLSEEIRKTGFIVKKGAKITFTAGTHTILDSDAADSENYGLITIGDGVEITNNGVLITGVEGRIVFKGGSLNNHGTLDVDRKFKVKNGTIQNDGTIAFDAVSINGTINNESGGEIVFDGNLEMKGSSVTNEGTLEFNGKATKLASTVITNDGTIKNTERLYIGKNAKIKNNGIILNSGTIEKIKNGKITGNAVTEE